MTAETRPVVVFDTLDEAKRDAMLRGACIVLDAHWRFWSTPLELSLLAVHSQMFATLTAAGKTPPDVQVIAPPQTFGRPA